MHGMIRKGYIGNERQLCGVRRVTVSDGRAGGAGVIEVWTAGGLTADILPDAGLDIGGTLIGMHLKEVAVPLHMQQTHVGKAILIAARTRPKFIGGERAHYDESMK